MMLAPQIFLSRCLRSPAVSATSGLTGGCISVFKTRHVSHLLAGGQAVTVPLRGHLPAQIRRCPACRCPFLPGLQGSARARPVCDRILAVTELLSCSNRPGR
jgi:hypothetical protein